MATEHRTGLRKELRPWQGETDAAGLAALAQRQIAQQEEERLQVARELHDVLGQSLTVLKLILDKVGHAPPAEISASLAEAAEVIDEIATRVRRVSRGLRPSMLELDLAAALTWLFGVYEEEYGLKVSFQTAGVGRPLPPDINTAVYRIVQEALRNVVGYAGVKRAWVRLTARDNLLTLEVADRGRGFEPAAIPAAQGAGLHYMLTRAALAGGTLAISSAPGAGTLISARFPLPPRRRTPPPRPVA